MACLVPAEIRRKIGSFLKAAGQIYNRHVVGKNMGGRAVSFLFSSRLPFSMTLTVPVDAAMMFWQRHNHHAFPRGVVHEFLDGGDVMCCGPPMMDTTVVMDDLGWRGGRLAFGGTGSIADNLD